MVKAFWPALLKYLKYMQMILLMGNLYRVKAGYITGESMLRILLQVLCAMNDSVLRETVYLLLFGNLPNEKQLNDFRGLLAKYRTLPTTFVRDIIMKAPSSDMMNALARSVLTLYAYDDLPNDTSIPNVLAQCMQLIALFPVLAVYGYNCYRHYHGDQSLIIHARSHIFLQRKIFLHLLRPDSKYTKMEARVLDLVLSFMQSMEEVITLPLLHMWYLHPARIHIQQLQLLWVL